MYLVLALFFSNNTNVGGTLGTPKGTIYINYKDIYEKWTTLYPHMQIGYTFFRKNRPSWIVKGKIEECLQNCHSLLTLVGSCSACKTGEQAASILKSCFFHLIKHLETSKKEICSAVGISALIEIFCKEINDVVMHNLFDIKHLMQHEVIQIHFICLM
jgi:hypothetical protein